MGMFRDPDVVTTNGVSAREAPATARRSARNLVARLLIARQALTRVLDRETSVPLIASFLVQDDYVLPPGFKCGTTPGLLECSVARLADGTSMLMTYWRSGAHLRAQRAAFLKVVGSSGSRGWASWPTCVPVADRSGRSRRWMRYKRAQRLLAPLLSAIRHIRSCGLRRKYL